MLESRRVFCYKMKTKKLILVISLLGISCITFAQTKNPPYRRSSLYTIMIPTDKLEGEWREIVTNTFDTLSIPDKYDDHNLSIRHLDLTKVQVTQEEIDAVSGPKGTKGFKGLMNKAKAIGKTLVNSSETGQMTDNERIAKMQKFFRTNHIANQLIAKWFNKSSQKVNGSYFNVDLIIERGKLSATQEELNIASLQRGDAFERVTRNAAEELVPQTFVMLTSYAYISAEEAAQLVAAGAGVVGGSIGAYTALGAQVAGTVTKGYVFTATSYLFQLEWDEETALYFYDNYYDGKKDIKAFDTDDKFILNYVGRTTSLVSAGDFSLKDEKLKKYISIATERATDQSIAKLQKKYEQFRALETLNVSPDGNTMYAYIGAKEGVKGGDKFEVMENVIDDEGHSNFNHVGTIKVAKGKVWDNRAGANENFHDGPGSKNIDIDPNACYTTFEGKPKGKIEAGLVIRQL